MVKIVVPLANTDAKIKFSVAPTLGKEKAICVACCGSSFHKYQLDLLLNCGAKKILIAFDKEGETWDKRKKYYRFSRYRTFYSKNISKKR